MAQALRQYESIMHDKHLQLDLQSRCCVRKPLVFATPGVRVSTYSTDKLLYCNPRALPCMKAVAIRSPESNECTPQCGENHSPMWREHSEKTPQHRGGPLNKYQWWHEPWEHRWGKNTFVFGMRNPTELFVPENTSFPIEDWSVRQSQAPQNGALHWQSSQRIHGFSWKTFVV